MKRTVMFLLLGPSLVALAVWMVAAAIAGRIDDGFIAVCTIASFLLTLPVSAITGLVDGYLARALPALLRAPPDRSYRHGGVPSAWFSPCSR